MARRKISKEEVVQKLKDDGDFDSLRVNIIRRLKDNVIPLPLSVSLQLGFVDTLSTPNTCRGFRTT
ncbi:hypothetical protein DY000_02045127 [Brassica cretica]|uniref:Uncharacterized protein n=1 Tax=Brassica cretica TaxID=69181 RepID=A0ABQ7F6U2_BRACR|nr:hypothetical protein DY000_02045127 [Brassica cretica]